MIADINWLRKASLRLILNKLNAVDKEKNKIALVKRYSMKKNTTKNIYQQNG
jgi:hypothetical protein